MTDIDSRKYPLSPDQLFPLLIECVSKAGFQIKNTEKEIRRIDISTGMSWFSFGESLELIVSVDGSGSILYVKSKAKIPWNMTSDIRGKVEALYDQVDRRIRGI